MDMRALLARIDPLAAPARRRVLADTARALAGTPELAALLAELAAVPGIPRVWAATMAVVADDDTHLRRLLVSADTRVAGLAMTHCARRDRHLDVLTAALATAPLAWRHTLYRAVRATGATTWAEALLPSVRARFGDHEAAAVLPACEAGTVTTLLPELDFAVPNLAALARRHPAVVLAHLRRRLAVAGAAGRNATWARFGPALKQLVRHDPAQLVDLLAHSGPPTGLPAGASRWLATAIAADPDRVVAILADPTRRIGFQPGRSTERALRRASDEALTSLARTWLTDATRLAALVRALPPGRRATVLSGALGDRNLQQAGLPMTVLDVLPWRSRHEHARRLLATRPVVDDPDLRRQATARLPWPEAEPLLRAATARPSAAERALGYPLLIGAAAATRDPDVVAGLLASLPRLPNEQDPVRHAALAAVAAIPGWLLRSADPSALVKPATDAVQARDASWGTRQAVGTTAVTLVRQGTLTGQPGLVESGLRILELSGGHAHTLTLHRLDQSLPRGAEHVVWAALRPRIAADARAGRYDLVLSLAAGLHRRAWPMADLQAVLGEATRAAEDHTVHRALELWLAPPATRDERVEAVLRRDSSTITVTAVANAVGGRRTDLLDRVLDRPPRGRFATRGVRLVPAFGGSAWHWLPRQVARYAELLADLATAPRKPVWERVSAVQRLAGLPGARIEDVEPFLQDDEVAVVEAALAGLAWVDRPGEALGTLLGHADTDRARVAVYAAGRAARTVPPAELGAALRPVLAGKKVTSRKEAIRLLAEHRVPGAAGELAALWAAPDLHRDLRRAIVSAARRLLDDERAWQWLTEATAMAAVATAVTEADPLTIAEHHRAPYGALVRTVTASADPDTARIGLAAWPAWSVWDRAGPAAVVTLIGDLTSTATWRYALDALLTACAVTGDPAPVHDVVTTLVEQAGVAVAGRDQPARQRLRLFLVRFAARLDAGGDAMRAAAEQLSMTLAERAEYRTDALLLAVSALPRRGDLLPALRRIAALADRPTAAWQVADRLAAWLAGHDPGRSELFDAAQALTASPAEALLAASVASQAGPHAGWPRPWRERVSALRDHPDADVRERASHIVLASE
ncbi:MULTISPECIES: hypothetical protein [unclassified Amycolatopsis]|uniref:hypothetical protein n=1 Tax=unclassified Amycolatopsis TaxID=2618356 RepID=UPI002876E420|nr:MULTISPECIES: hypothetical protein [unclassified Amycolatopsis]MDS0136032.1 hypothetical protein [Amycolatopsis sp. 505]MDS0145379.1 hypothetical protein [Amycolatopsis sp. CM201R]